MTENVPGEDGFGDFGEFPDDGQTPQAVETAAEEEMDGFGNFDEQPAEESQPPEVAPEEEVKAPTMAVPETPKIEEPK